VHVAARAVSGLPCESGFRLPRSARLRRRAEYRKVYEDGARAVGRYLVLFGVRRAAEAVSSRLGVTASRRVGGAVVRARCKRRIRELYRLHPDELPTVPVDLVVNARRGCADIAWDALRQDYLRSIRTLRDRLQPSPAVGTTTDEGLRSAGHRGE
jgi:ribonuclease P protein component